MPLVAADVGGEELLVHRKPGVRDQTLRRLRRGLVPVEGELDLHGMSQAAARELLAFLASPAADAAVRRHGMEPARADATSETP